MSDQIKVGFGEMAEGAANLGNAANQIEGELSTLDQYMKPKIADWEGDAKEAYFQAKTQWDQAAQDLQQVLARIGSAVRGAGDAYQQGEKANASRFGA